MIDPLRAPGGVGRRSSRDREMIAVLARHGLLTLPLLMAAMGTGRTVTYRRFARCEAAGLVERVSVPVLGAVLRATREGQRYVGLGDLPFALVRPGAVVHELRCAELALRLEDEGLGEDARLLSGRELSFAERVEGRPIAGARIGSHGRDGWHRPDLAIVSPDRVIAVEAELTIKTPRRLEQIVRAWRRATHVDRIDYHCGSAGVRRAVERAVATTHADGRVRVLELR